MSFSNRYIELDSTYRDRTNWPNPSEFTVSPGARRINVTDAIDPIYDSVPNISGRIWNTGVSPFAPTSTVFPVTYTGTIGYSDPMIMGTGYYNGEYVEVWNQFGTGSTSKLLDFGPNGDQTMADVELSSPLTQITGVSSGSAYTPNLSDFYYFRRKPPDERGMFTNGSTQYNLAFSGPASTVSNYYKDKYVFVTGRNPTIAGEYGRIAGYSFTGGTGYAMLMKPIIAAPVAGDTYDINSFSYDNVCPLLGSNSSFTTPYADYNVRCLHVTVPGILIVNGKGGLITNYPYAHIELSSAQQSTFSQPIYSNHPFTEKMLFKFYIDGTSYGDFIPLIDCNQVVTVKMNPLAPLHFKLTLPDGSVPIFGGPDDQSPLPPIDIKRLVKV